MKKAFFVVVLLAGLVGGLAAQTSASDFRIVEARNLASNLTLRRASEMLSERIASVNEMRDYRFSPYRLIQEKTRMEEQLVSRARRELPDNPSAGSMWSVWMAATSNIGGGIYIIIFFVDRDRQVYHWMYCSSFTL
jgi:hypothetical protein